MSPRQFTHRGDSSLLKKDSPSFLAWHAETGDMLMPLPWSLCRGAEQMWVVAFSQKKHPVELRGVVHHSTLPRHVQTLGKCPLARVHSGQEKDEDAGWSGGPSPGLPPRHYDASNPSGSLRRILLSIPKLRQSELRLNRGGRMNDSLELVQGRRPSQRKG